MKPSELIMKATKSGCETITDYVAWAYAQGQKDTYDEVLRDMKRVEGDKKEDDLDFLKPDWTPKSVTHYTNKDKS